MAVSLRFAKPARIAKEHSIAPAITSFPSTSAAGITAIFGVAGGQDPRGIVLDVEAVLSSDFRDVHAEDTPELAQGEFSRGDYYTERESEGIVSSRWHGRGAEQLGLWGRVKPDHFARLLEGKDPSGQRVLVAHREGLDERRRAGT